MEVSTQSIRQSAEAGTRDDADLQPSSAPTKPPHVGAAVLVDGHVHYHDAFDLTEFLDAAWRNLQAAAGDATSTDHVLGCLLVAEIQPVAPLERLGRDASGLGRPWSLETTSDQLSLLACRNGEPAMAIVAGRQIVSSEGIEILALAGDHDFAAGQPLAELLKEIQDAQALPVLPWGLGKWLFRRGDVIKRILNECAARDGQTALFLGDNSGRARHLPDSSIFQLARARDVPILPGSDPLNLPSHVHQAGRYGFVMPGQLDLNEPARHLRAWLQSITNSPQVFGRRDSLARCCRSQVSLRIRSRTA